MFSQTWSDTRSDWVKWQRRVKPIVGWLRTTRQQAEKKQSKKQNKKSIFKNYKINKKLKKQKKYWCLIEIKRCCKNHYMICLQRGCAISASLQYSQGTHVCNMKNTDANKQHSSHNRSPYSWLPPPLSNLTNQFHQAGIKKLHFRALMQKIMKNYFYLMVKFWYYH